MGAFSVGSFSMDENDWLRGFSFTPNVSGPDGSGSPGSATSAAMISAIVGCPSQTAAEQATKCYVYSQMLTSTDEIGSPTGLVGMSSSMSVGQVFGSGGYSSTYQFTDMPLDPTQVYYAYFSDNTNVSVDTNAPYTGGTDYDIFMDDDGTSPQFQVNMST